LSLEDYGTAATKLHQSLSGKHSAFSFSEIRAGETVGTVNRLNVWPMYADNEICICCMYLEETIDYLEVSSFSAPSVMGEDGIPDRKDAAPSSVGFSDCCLPLACPSLVVFNTNSVSVT
jgi:hypothetical protein